ncbi:N-formylglutamate amidohydrolase [Roseinatronobacter alkalisoli]|uniref:N-formylglutamate amidohydrolase n=1 Tax=Roseinatronobacter alkalisoli TaxID=3028235 RepID=A0ABT5TAV6_9RHOB|nr:N-formylglutamate amidohydrolase [Roseinatronobacter sp. HJB301]MDD7972250.1 N-formylglutamate amidohydrolase [Roseinatronobacter sp. HJB301]
MTLIPAVLEILGTDSQRLPLVFDSPHSGTDYPADFRPIADPALLRMAEDTHVHTLFSGAVDAGAVLLHALFPRAYIDTNRAADDLDPAQIDGTMPMTLRPSVKSRNGIGLCWTRVPPDGAAMYDRPLTAAEITHRITTYHQRYQTTLRDLLDGAHTRWGQVWHVNCHSMPHRASAMSPEPPGTTRADFVLGDRDGTTCAPAMTETIRAFLAARGVSVGINDPYKGMELVRANGAPAANRHSIQIEINRRLYMNEATREPNAGFAPLQALLRDLSAHLGEFVTSQLQGQYP